MTTAIPPQITTPDSVETRLGTLKFFDGFPDDATVEKVMDNLDFSRGVQAFLSGMPGASLVGMRTGFQKLGAINGSILIFENLLDSKSLFLTGNTDSVYFSTWLNLKEGPLVLETPPKVLAFLDDFWFQYVIDIGNAGPDKGQGGKYLVVPPGYKGEVPEGYFVARSRTYNLWLMGRGFKVDGDLKPGVESIKENLRIYPLAQAKNPPETKFINASGVELNTVHANDFSYFEELNQDRAGGAQRGTGSRKVGVVRLDRHREGQALCPRCADEKDSDRGGGGGERHLPGHPLPQPNEGGLLLSRQRLGYNLRRRSYEFLSQPGVRNLDARTMFHYYATGITPAMAMKMVGIGSQYAAAFVDSEGKPLDGSKTYKIHLPPHIPAKDFWSFVVYDNQTRSMLQTDQQFPSIGSQTRGHRHESRHIGGCLVWPHRAERSRGQLGADRSGQRLECTLSPLWSAAAMVRQDMEAG